MENLSIPEVQFPTNINLHQYTVCKAVNLNSHSQQKKVQNKLFRILNNTTINDKIRTKNIAQDLNMLSTNQINAQIKLTEVWKILNVENYPQMGIQKPNSEGPMLSRAASRGDLLVKGKTELRQSSFINDAAKIWNSAPLNIKLCKTISSEKTAIKKFVKTLPI